MMNDLKYIYLCFVSCISPYPPDTRFHFPFTSSIAGNLSLKNKRVMQQQQDECALSAFYLILFDQKNHLRKKKKKTQADF